MLGKKRTQIHRSTSMSQLRLPPHTREMEEPPQQPTLGPKSCPLPLSQQNGSSRSHGPGHVALHQKQAVLEKKESTRIDGHSHGRGVVEKQRFGLAGAEDEEAFIRDEQSSSVVVVAAAADHEESANGHIHGHGHGNRCLHTQTESLHVANGCNGHVAEDNSVPKANSQGIEPKFAEIPRADDRLKQQLHATTAPLEEALRASLNMSPGRKSNYVQATTSITTKPALKIASSPNSGLAAPKHPIVVSSPSLRAPRDGYGFPSARRPPAVLGLASERQRPANPFLQVCFNCKRRLQPGRDIYMYRGDMAFCSEECRMQQILWDERQEAAAGSGSKKDIKKASSVSSKSCNSRKTVPAVAA